MGAYGLRARRSLRPYRQASIIAIGFAALLLLLFLPLEQADPDAAYQPAFPTSAADAETAAPEKSAADQISPGAAAEEATGTVRDLLAGAYAIWPKVAIAAAILVLAWGLSGLLEFMLKKLLRNWTKAEALGTFSGVVLFLLAVGAALSIIAGDVRALVGSVGLVGLALSWALQAPIESFTGWLLNSFRAYYRVGDRIGVGEVFGDVYKIDILTTTVWESGGPDKAVKAAQPTGALITFPNSEVLRNNIVNYTRDFSYVWDEITFGIAIESDLAYALEVVRRAARRELGRTMPAAIEEYRQLLEKRGLLFEIAEGPQVYLSPADSWTDLTVRYLVPARERRLWAHQVFLAISTEIGKPEHRPRISPALPRLRLDHGPEN